MSVIPANPKIANSKPYPGNSDGAAAGPRAGMDEWIRQAIKYGAGAFWNNGSWGVRDMRGSENLSVHATGRAVDLSYRKSDKHPSFGRGWQCTRQAWSKYSKPTIHGAPGGDGLHVEITPAMADSPALVKQAFQRVFGEIPQ